MRSSRRRPSSPVSSPVTLARPGLPAADNTGHRRHLLPACLLDPNREGLPRDHDFLPLDRAGNLKMESPRKPETPLQVGQGQGPNHPGGGGGGRTSRGSKVMTCAPIAVLASAALPLLLALLLPPSQAGPGVGGGRWGLRSPTCTRISVMCTYMCPAWATHVACVYLRSDACSVYTPATCTGHGVYTMDLAHELHMCACARSPGHEHGACHMERHMHWALRTAILSVGTVAYARVCTQTQPAGTHASQHLHTCPLWAPWRMHGCAPRHSLPACTLHSIYTRVLCVKFSVLARRRHTSVCAPSLQTGCTYK